MTIPIVEQEKPEFQGTHAQLIHAAAVGLWSEFPQLSQDIRDWAKLAGGETKGVEIDGLVLWEFRDESRLLISESGRGVKQI